MTSTMLDIGRWTWHPYVSLGAGTGDYLIDRVICPACDAEVPLTAKIHVPVGQTVEATMAAIRPARDQAVADCPFV